MRAFVAEGSMLVGDLRTEEITFSTLNLRGWCYRLCIGAASIVLKICLGWCGVNSSLVSGFYFLGDSLTILFASEGNRSFVGGSDVVHCVRVPLTGTTLAEFWAFGSLVGIGFCTFSYCVYNIVDIGGPPIIVM